MKKILCLLLCVLTVFSLLACSGKNGDENNEPQTSISTDNEGEGSREDVSDDLPDRNFDGAEFVILAPNYLKQYMLPEESSGNAVDEEIVRRNDAVESRFNVKLKLITGDTYIKVEEMIYTDIMAESKSQYTLIDQHAVQAGATALRGELLNWYEIPYINFDKPWWSDSVVNDLTFNGKNYLAIGDYNLSALNNTYCYYYNTKDAEDLDIPDLNKVVEDGNWTVEYVENTVLTLWDDVNGDGNPDPKDYYGLTSSPYSAANAYFWAFGEKIIVKDENNGMVVDFGRDNEKISGVVEKLYNLMHTNRGVDCYRGLEPDGSDAIHNVARSSFSKKLCLFASGTFSDAKYHTMMEVEFGILPYPKYDTNQAEYYTNVDGSHGVLAVPLNADPNKFEMIGIITEALNAESYKKVVPEFYEVQLKIRYQTDATGAAMIDRISDSRVFDAGYLYGGINDYNFLLQRLVGVEKSKDYVSHYAAVSGSTNETMQKIVDFFMKEEA